jgi:hypothetical protein
VTEETKVMRPKWHEFDEDCVCGHPNGRNAECERCRLIDRIMTSERLLMSLARHIRNTDELPVVKWGIRGIDLLHEVRDYNKQKYEQTVAY